MAPNSDDETRPSAETEDDDDEKGKKGNPAPLLARKDIPLKDIKSVANTDVLCGRGGAALRHPGNQTYRRLVHLNKGLYITCLKAEKLKISKSIVAAIREQSGRFLEKDKKGLWYDIGDKKAMEKTSQALREGQPKLRQKIVELGGGAAGAAALLEHQFTNTNPTPNGIQYPPSSNHNNAYGPASAGPLGLEHSSAAAAAAAAAGGGNYHLPTEMTGSSGGLNLNSRSPRMDANNSTAAIQHHNGTAVFSAHDEKSIMNRMSRHDERKEDQGYASASASSPGRAHQPHQQQQQHHPLSSSVPSFTPSLTQRGSAAAQLLGVDESTLSAMSSYSNSNSNNNNNSSSSSNNNNNNNNNNFGSVAESPVMTIDQAYAHLTAQHNTQARQAPPPSQHPHLHEQQHTRHLAAAHHGSSSGGGGGTRTDYHESHKRSHSSSSAQNHHHPGNSMTSYRRQAEEKTYEGEEEDDDHHRRDVLPVPDKQGTKSNRNIKMERRRMLEQAKFNPPPPNHPGHPHQQQQQQQQQQPHHPHHPHHHQHHPHPGAPPPPSGQQQQQQQQHPHHYQSTMHNQLPHPGAAAAAATGGVDDMPDIHFVPETDAKSYMSNMSSSVSGDNHYQTDEDDEDEEKVDPHRRADVASIISGFSKMSTNSTGTDEGSIFSDLSRKIGNVSTRSLLSDLSGMEDSDSEFSDDMDDHRHYGGHTTNHHHPHPSRRQTATPTSVGSMEYD